MRGNRQKSAAPMGSRRIERQEPLQIENYNSPKTRHTDENAGIIFSAFLFVVVALAVGAFGAYALGGINIWIVALAIALAVLAVFSIRIAPQWEKVVILRLGKFNRTVGP